jgi:hypothetical protein
MAKDFFITIDAEADNQWDFNHKNSTENSKFLPRFQELSEKYGFKPTWLTSFEMANDDFYCHYMKEKQKSKLCEIGMHLHAWNTPPEFPLKKILRERDYLIEYPLDVMDAKVATITDFIELKFGKRPVSHRSGRWTTNQDYFKILKKYGYEIDCSVTPHVDWSQNFGVTGMPGSDYTKYPEQPYYIYDNILEIPMSIRCINVFAPDTPCSIWNVYQELKTLLKGRIQWLRPDSSFRIKPMLKLIENESKKNQYLMFMIHSSELMPGGSPYFKDEASIEKLYLIIEYLFEKIKLLGYKGKSLIESKQRTY